MRLFLGILVLLGLTGAALKGATENVPRTCAVCSAPLTNRYFVARSPSFDSPQGICQRCSMLPARCAECALPVKTGQTLSDGRVLCAQHFASGIFNQDDARHVFRDVQRDVMRMLAGSGTLPNANVTVFLRNRTQLVDLLKDQDQIHGDSTLGLTLTRMNEDRSQQHRIFLLSGLSRPSLESVCAHEYAHTWVNENVKREIEPKMVEAFCELVAYKLADQNQRAGQKLGILSNNYTAGRIQTLIKANDSYRFGEVIDWMKSGKDSTFAFDEVDRLLAVRRPVPALYHMSPSAQTRVPEKLTLRGVSGTARRRFALVNDRTLEVNEEGRVRVGTSHVSVRCLEISDTSVQLRVLDSGTTVSLSLLAE